MTDERTLEQMQADHMRTRGFGLIEQSRWVRAAEAVERGLGSLAFQQAARDWLAAHPEPRITLGRRIRVVHQFEPGEA